MEKLKEVTIKEALVNKLQVAADRRKTTLQRLTQRILSSWIDDNEPREMTIVPAFFTGRDYKKVLSYIKKVNKETDLPPERIASALLLSAVIKREAEERESL